MTSDLFAGNNVIEKADIVSREEIVVCGMQVAKTILHMYDKRLRVELLARLGQLAVLLLDERRDVEAGAVLDILHALLLQPRRRHLMERSKPSKNFSDADADSPLRVERIAIRNDE